MSAKYLSTLIFLPLLFGCLPESEKSSTQRSSGSNETMELFADPTDPLVMSYQDGKGGILSLYGVKDSGGYLVEENMLEYSNEDGLQRLLIDRVSGKYTLATSNGDIVNYVVSEDHVSVEIEHVESGTVFFHDVKIEDLKHEINESKSRLDFQYYNTPRTGELFLQPTYKQSPVIRSTARKIDSNTFLNVKVEACDTTITPDSIFATVSTPDKTLPRIFYMKEISKGNYRSVTQLNSEEFSIYEDAENRANLLYDRPLDACLENPNQDPDLALFGLDLLKLATSKVAEVIQNGSTGGGPLATAVSYAVVKLGEHEAQKYLSTIKVSYCQSKNYHVARAADLIENIVTFDWYKDLDVTYTVTSSGQVSNYNFELPRDNLGMSNLISLQNSEPRILDVSVPTTVKTKDEGYIVNVSFICTEPTDTYSINVKGSDEYTDSVSGNISDPDMVYELFVPGAEGGVQDDVTIFLMREIERDFRYFKVVFVD